MDLQNKFSGKSLPGLEQMRRMYGILLKFAEVNQRLEIKQPSASARIGPHIASIATILNSSIADETARVNRRRLSSIFEETSETLEPDPILQELRAGSVPEWSFSIIESKTASTSNGTVSNLNATAAPFIFGESLQRERRPPAPMFPPGLPLPQALKSIVENKEDRMNLAMMELGGERRSILGRTASRPIAENKGNDTVKVVVKPVATPDSFAYVSVQAVVPTGQVEKCIIASTTYQTPEQRKVAVPFAKASKPQSEATGLSPRDGVDSRAASAPQKVKATAEAEQLEPKTEASFSAGLSWAQIVGKETSPAKSPPVVASINNSSASTDGEPAEVQLRIVFITNLPRHTTLHAIANTVTEGALYSIRFGVDTETGARYCGIIFHQATAASEYLAKMNMMAARFASHSYVEAWLWPFASPNYDGEDAATQVGIMLGEAFPATQELARMEFVGRVPVGNMTLPETRLQFRARRRLTVIKAEIFRTWTFEGFRMLCEKLVGGAANLQWVVVWNWGEASVCCADVIAAVKLKEKLQKFKRFKDADVNFSMDPCEKLRGVNLPERGTRGVLSWPAVWINPK